MTSMEGMTHKLEESCHENDEKDKEIQKLKTSTSQKAEVSG